VQSTSTAALRSAPFSAAYTTIIVGFEFPRGTGEEPSY
jgi:hypothetical protein